MHTLLRGSGSTRCSFVRLSHTGKRFKPTLHCLMMLWSSMLKILNLLCMLTTIYHQKTTTLILRRDAVMNHHTDWRVYALSLVDEGITDYDTLLIACMKWMSQDDVFEMLDANELSPRFVEES